MSNIYKAIVVNNNDPERRGRVQIGVVGLDDFNKLNNSKSDKSKYEEELKKFPWAEVIQGTFLGISGGTGAFSTLQVNTSVWVINDDFNKPLVFGVAVGGKEGRNTDYYDNIELAYEGAQDHPDVPTENIPYHKDNTYGVNLEATNTTSNIYEDKYLSTSVIKTPAGHIIELDDTRNTRAIRIIHSNKQSCITLNEDSSIDIKADIIRFNAVEDMHFFSGRNMSFQVKGSMYLNVEDSISTKCQEITNNVGWRIMNDIKGEKAKQYQKSEGGVYNNIQNGSDVTYIENGCFGVNASSGINITCEDSVNITSNKEAIMQAQKGSVVCGLSGTAVNASDGKTVINGNKCILNTDTDVRGGVNSTGVIQTSQYLLGLDMYTCIPMNAGVSALNESVKDDMNIQDYGETETREINNEYKYIQNMKTDDSESQKLQREKFENLKKRFEVFNTLVKNKQQQVKKAIIQDYVQSQSQFRDVSPDEIQMLNESVNGLSIIPRSPNGKKLFEEQSKCSCNWLDPSNWFNIDLPTFPDWDDFKNCFEFKITWPNLSDLFPNIPKISFQSIINTVMSIAMMPIIKLISIMKSFIMQALSPIISLLNKITSIINMIPPKITLNLDFNALFPKPLFSFPELPSNVGLNNICCTLNQCNCSDCGDKIDEYTNKVNEKAKDLYSYEQSDPTLPDNIPGKTVKTASPNGKLKS